MSVVVDVCTRLGSPVLLTSEEDIVVGGTGTGTQESPRRDDNRGDGMGHTPRFPYGKDSDVSQVSNEERNFQPTRLGGLLSETPIC